MTLKYRQPVTCENVLYTTQKLNSLFLLLDQAHISIISGHYWGVGNFYTAEEALTLLMNMSDFEDESTSESEIEGDSSESSEYIHLNNNIRSEQIQIFKHYCLKKQLIRMP